jgi:hypothetical protein
MRINNQELELDGTDMNSDIISNAIYLGHIANFSIQTVFTGAGISGDFKLQASNDKGPNDVHSKDQAAITNWTDVGNTQVSIISAGNHMYNVQNCGYRWVRLIWTDTTSPDGLITSARYNVKGV